MKNLLGYTFLGTFLLFLFHFESLSIGPIKISHLWKGALLIFILMSVVRKRMTSLYLYKPLIILAILQLINLELIISPFNAFLLFSTTLILPLLGIYLVKFSSKKLKRLMLFFAAFFVLSFIPYELGILKSFKEGYVLTSYGMDANGIIGPFQNVHAASTALAASFLVILYFWLSKSFNRLYLSVLLVFSFYFLIFTYVRTGMAMVVIGIIPMLVFFTRNNLSTRIRLIFISGIFSILISGWVLTDETMMDRILGNRKNSSEMESFENMGSGRGMIYTYAVEMFLEANLLEKIIGMGQSEQKLRMESKLGAALIPHNGFLLLLLNNGIIGIFVFFLFIRKILIVTKYISHKERALVRSLFYAYLVMSFFQSFDLLYMYFILILGLTYAFNKEKETYYRIII